MIVSRKTTYWKNLEGHGSRLSGPYYRGAIYKVNWGYHRLYGRSAFNYFHINDMSFRIFKEV